jgi:nucleotide-binding universal stress UspA family protein
MIDHRRHTVFQKILVAYDGSTHSDKAVDAALSVARYLDSKVLIFSVAQPPEPAQRAELQGVLDDAKERFEEAFKRIVEAAKAEDIDIETEMAVGHPAEQIIHKAETSKADLVILGRRGRSTFQKWILGSISEKVLRYAHCPVMVVH